MLALFLGFAGFRVGFGSLEKFTLFIIWAQKAVVHSFGIGLSRLSFEILHKHFPVHRDPKGFSSQCSDIPSNFLG